jgi:carbon monoxide dehydrogenase subunit G
MELVNEFNIPLPPEQAWDVLLDIPRIAPCMPGATLTEVVDAETYKGMVSVKIGPVALVFSGTARFREIDPVKKTAVVKAQGNDTKGRGNANAVVSFSLATAPDGSIVTVKTNLNLSGSVAQYGRGVGIIQAVAAELTGAFARNLQAELAKSEAGTSETAYAPAAAPPLQEPVAISGLSLLWKSLWRMLWPRRSATPR